MPANNRGVFEGADNVDVLNTEQDVRDLAEQLLIEQKDNVSGPDGVTVRQILPEEDLESGGDNGWDGNDRSFKQSGLSADAENTVYEIDHNLKAENKVVIIYAVSNKSGSPISTQIQYENTTGGVIEKQNVEGSLTDPEDTLLLADPLVFGTGNDGTIIQWADEAGDDEVLYHGVVAEPNGETLEESSRFLSDLAGGMTGGSGA